MKHIITLSLFALLFCSCNPYKKIATDVNRTDKNKAILRQTCEAVFPASPPVYIKGKDSIITVTDSVTDTVYTYSHDTVTKTIYKTITATNTVYRVDTFKTDNKYLISEINTLKTDIAVVTSERDTFKGDLTKLKFKQFLGWLLFFAGAAGFVLLKLKS